MKTIRYFIVIISSLICTYTDLKNMKIKNKITVSTAAIGVLLSFFGGGVTPFEAVAGLILPFLICLVFYIAKMLRAGDIKLFMALGAVMGLRWILRCMAASVIFGGITAAVLLIKRKYFIKGMKKLFEYLKITFYSGIFAPYRAEKEETFSFAFCVLGGVIIVLLRDI